MAGPCTAVGGVELSGRTPWAALQAPPGPLDLLPSWVAGASPGTPNARARVDRAE